MLCVVVCPTDAFHENIEPEGQISLEEFPAIDKFYTIDFNKCTEDKDNEICQLCLTVRDRNHIQDFFKISKECPVNSLKLLNGYFLKPFKFHEFNVLFDHL